MKTLISTRAIIFAFLYPSGLFVTGQNVSSTGSPALPISANSSSIASPGSGSLLLSNSSSSTAFIGTEHTSASATELLGNSSSTPGTSTPETSNDPTTLATTSLKSNNSMTISNNSSMLKTSITSGATSKGDVTSSNSDSTTVTNDPPSSNSTLLASPTSNNPSSDSVITSVASSNSDIASSTVGTMTVTNGPPNSNSSLIPPWPTGTTSRYDGIVLPPGVTLPPDPSTTLLPTGTEIQSSASDMSIAIAGIFPLLQRWIDAPQPPQLAVVTNALDDILPKATNFLGMLPKPTGGLEPCKSGNKRRFEEGIQDLQTLGKRSFLGGLFKTAFSLVTCVIDTNNKVREAIIKGAIDTVKNLEIDLKPMVDALKEVDPNDSNDPDASPTSPISPTLSSSSSSSSLSSSCTLNTVSNCNVACTATATTTVGRARRRADVESCTTVCEAPITKCGATGATSASTVTSTTTAAIRLCARDCPGCGDPAPTISEMPTGVDIVARDMGPHETGSHNDDLQKRAFTNPHDDEWRGDVGKWLLKMINHSSSHRLQHGTKPGWFTTAISEELLDRTASWNLGNMYGCTAVIVVSRRRIFMAHIWQSPTMDNKYDSFQRDAIDVLGDEQGVQHGLSMYTAGPEAFANTEQNKVQAIIITPYNPESSDPESGGLYYEARVEEISAMLMKVLRLSETQLPKIVPYEIREPDPDFEFPHGKIFIQYDPVKEMNQIEGQSCLTQVAGLEVWFEELNDTPRYFDAWDALPNQIVVTESEFSKRFIRDNRVTGVDDKEWQEEERILRRQNGLCVRPSGSLSASSNVLDPTTLQTSFVSSSAGGNNTGGPLSSGAFTPSTMINPPPTFGASFGSSSVGGNNTGSPLPPGEPAPSTTVDLSSSLVTSFVSSSAGGNSTGSSLSPGEPAPSTTSEMPPTMSGTPDSRTTIGQSPSESRQPTTSNTVDLLPTSGTLSASSLAGGNNTNSPPPSGQPAPSTTSDQPSTTPEMPGSSTTNDLLSTTSRQSKSSTTGGQPSTMSENPKSSTTSDQPSTTPEEPTPSTTSDQSSATSETPESRTTTAEESAPSTTSDPPSTTPEEPTPSTTSDQSSTTSETPKSGTTTSEESVPSTTSDPPPATSEKPAPSTPPPAPAKTKALSIILELYIEPDPGPTTQNWIFFETRYQEAVGCRSRDDKDSIKLKVPDDYTIHSIENVENLYPGGEHQLIDLWGETCSYKNDGTNAGRLFCPSSESGYDCKMEPNLGEGGEYECGGPEITRHAMISCEW